LGAELLAIVRIDSFGQGVEGYVQLLSKTNGIQKFCDQLRWLRKKKQLTQTEVAAQVGMT
jgi:ribosomal 30S subunit maturation factor RimM